MKKWVVLGAVAAFAVLATGVTANAEMGVGVKWEGSGVTPDMVFPISLASGIIITPQLGLNITEEGGMSAESLDNDDYLIAGAMADDDPKTPKLMQIRFGVSVEKETAPGGTTALFGARAMVIMNSPSDKFVSITDDQGVTTMEELDSWMDIEFGVFIGGSASLADNVDIVGAWGPTITLLGSADAGGTEYAASATNIGSSAHLMLRWWLWGQ